MRKAFVLEVSLFVDGVDCSAWGPICFHKVYADLVHAHGSCWHGPDMEATVDVALPHVNTACVEVRLRNNGAAARRLAFDVSLRKEGTVDGFCGVSGRWPAS